MSVMSAALAFLATPSGQLVSVAAAAVIGWKLFTMAADIRQVYQSVGGKNGKGSIQERMNDLDVWRSQVDSRIDLVEKRQKDHGDILIEQSQDLASLMRGRAR